MASNVKIYKMDAKDIIRQMFRKINGSMHGKNEKRKLPKKRICIST